MRLGKRESTVARRKVVLIIVEGPSDAEVLAPGQIFPHNAGLILSS